MCKIEGCEEPSAARQGPYAGLCIPHADEAKERRRINMRAKREENRKNPKGADDPIAKEIKKIKGAKRQTARAAVEIVKAAEKFDISIEERDDATTRAKLALKDLDAALDDFKRVVKAKLDAKFVSTKE